MAIVKGVSAGERLGEAALCPGAGLLFQFTVAAPVYFVFIFWGEMTQRFHFWVEGGMEVLPNISNSTTSKRYLQLHVHRDSIGNSQDTETARIHGHVKKE